MGMALVLQAWIEMTDSRCTIPGALILSLTPILIPFRPAGPGVGSRWRWPWEDYPGGGLPWFWLL